MGKPSHKGYFKANESYFLSQPQNQKLLIGLFKVIKVFNVHPWAYLSALQKDYKIDSFAKLNVDDPLAKILSSLDSNKDDCKHLDCDILIEHLDLDDKYLNTAQEEQRELQADYIS